MIVCKEYEDSAVKTDEELEGIKKCHNNLEGEIQQLTKNLTNHKLLGMQLKTWPGDAILFTMSLKEQSWLNLLKLEE